MWTIVNQGGFLYHWLILIATKLSMVIIWKVKNNVIYNKTYQFWQHWLSLHSLYWTGDFQVRKINMVQFVNTVQCFLQIVYGIVTDHKRRNYNIVKNMAESLSVFDCFLSVRKSQQRFVGSLGTFQMPATASQSSFVLNCRQKMTHLINFFNKGGSNVEDSTKIHWLRLY